MLTAGGRGGNAAAWARAAKPEARNPISEANPKFQISNLKSQIRRSKRTNRPIRFGHLNIVISFGLRISDFVASIGLENGKLPQNVAASRHQPSGRFLLSADL
jgi:hypothetical protein